MRNRRSIGELISTLTFFGLALYLVPYSLAVIEEGDNLRGYFGPSQLYFVRAEH